MRTPVANFAAQATGSALVAIALSSAGAPLWGAVVGGVGVNLVAGSYASDLRDRLRR